MLGWHHHRCKLLLLRDRGLGWRAFRIRSVVLLRRALDRRFRFTYLRRRRTGIFLWFCKFWFQQSHSCRTGSWVWRAATTVLWRIRIRRDLGWWCFPSLLLFRWSSNNHRWCLFLFLFLLLRGWGRVLFGFRSRNRRGACCGVHEPLLLIIMSHHLRINYGSGRTTAIWSRGRVLASQVFLILVLLVVMVTVYWLPFLVITVEEGGRRVVVVRIVKVAGRGSSLPWELHVRWHPRLHLLK